mgnify:CR=1 FL=1
MQKPRGCDKMATLLQEILTNNHEFLANNKYTKEISKYPQKKFALLTCMDTRLVELINKALGIHRGDAKIIQNAGTSFRVGRSQSAGKGFWYGLMTEP